MDRDLHNLLGDLLNGKGDIHVADDLDGGCDVLDNLDNPA